MKKQAKKQGVALAISSKKKSVRKRSISEINTADFYRAFKDFTPVGTIYFEPYLGPAKITKIEKWSSRSVMLTLEVVLGDSNTGEISAATRRIEKHHMPKAFDVKKFLKEINALYKKTYLS